MILGADGQNDTFYKIAPRLGNKLAGKENTHFQIILQWN